MVPSSMKPLLQSKHVVSCLVKMCLPQHLAIGGLRKLVEVGEASAELAVPHIQQITIHRLRLKAVDFALWCDVEAKLPLDWP